MWYLDSGGGGAVEITKLEKKVSGISILLFTNCDDSIIFDD